MIFPSLGHGHNCVGQAGVWSSWERNSTVDDAEQGMVWCGCEVYMHVCTQ